MPHITFAYGDTDSSVYHIRASKRSFIMIPEQRKYATEIPLLDGYVDMQIGGYKEAVIVLDLFYDGTPEQLDAERDAIFAWLANIGGKPKRLALGDESGRYYMAKVYDAVDLSNVNGTALGSVSFECNPPWPYKNGVLLTPDQVLWVNQDHLDGVQWLKEFRDSGAFRFINGGLEAAKPVIKLIGSIPAGLLLASGSDQWQYTAALPYDGIVIDCAAETVTQLSTGANLIGNVDPSKDAFFGFAPGQCEIDLTASGLGAWPQSISMIIDFNPD